MAGNPITELRTGVADRLRAALGPDSPVIVYTGWPTGPAAPCLVVRTGGDEHVSRCLHDVDVIITALAPNGDPTAAVESLDGLLAATVIALNVKGPVRVGWDEPTAETHAGNPYLTADLRLTEDAQLVPAPQQ